MPGGRSAGKPRAGGAPIGRRWSYRVTDASSLAVGSSDILWEAIFKNQPGVTCRTGEFERRFANRSPAPDPTLSRGKIGPTMGIWWGANPGPDVEDVNHPPTGRPLPGIFHRFPPPNVDGDSIPSRWRA